MPVDVIHAFLKTIVAQLKCDGLHARRVLSVALINQHVKCLGRCGELQTVLLLLERR